MQQHCMRHAGISEAKQTADVIKGSAALMWALCALQGHTLPHRAVPSSAALAHQRTAVSTLRGEQHAVGQQKNHSVLASGVPASGVPASGVPASGVPKLQLALVKKMSTASPWAS